ncbi:unnamed protein product [Euphydryas editha]|uniref:Uncharacterized protein n=1 Tax=Euphydryas editha TaxID=104508 RepID=A0AAU9TXQ5_EUPED|nr:unnamed protein product [Euphydryas editha]
MDFRVLYISLLLALTEIQAKQLDSGPQAVKDSASASNSTQKSQKRYATKEIILYLTPSQIKDLQAGKTFLDTQSIYQSAEKQVQNNQRLSPQEHDELVRQQFENIKAAKVYQSEKPNYDNLELISHIPSYQKYERINENQQIISDAIDVWKQNQAKIEEQAKSQYLYTQSGEDQKIEQWSLPKQKQPEVSQDTWIPFEPASEKNQDIRLLNEQFKQQWNRILEHNRNQLKALSAVKPITENSEPILLQTEKPLLQAQYAPRYNDQKHAIEIEEILKNHRRQELEKKNALETAEPLINSPPILIHQEIKVTKHKPVPVVKHVKVQVPTPVLIPVPEPYEVKVPHPYPVPFEIVKPIPVPIWKTEKVEAERPASYEAQKQTFIPVTKNVYINFDRPYYVEKYNTNRN